MMKLLCCFKILSWINERLNGTPACRDTLAEKHCSKLFMMFSVGGMGNFKEIFVTFLVRLLSRICQGLLITIVKLNCQLANPKLKHFIFDSSFYFTKSKFYKTLSHASSVLAILCIRTKIIEIFFIFLQRS